MIDDKYLKFVIIIYYYKLLLLSSLSLLFVARIEEEGSAFKILIAKPTRKRPLGRPSHKRGDNIQMDLKEVGISERNWIDSAQNRNYWRALVD